MGQLICAGCGEASQANTCDRCKWAKRRKAPCSICGGPTGYAVTDNRAPASPVCRECNVPTHGTTNTYRAGCRCGACREAYNAARRRYVEGRAKRDPDWRNEQRSREQAKVRANYSYTEELRTRDAIRRARKAGAAVEKFDNCEVFERDGWVCLICLRPTDQHAVWPDPTMPSLDHVVPLSLGGEHSRANTRCTHLGCNVRRGNRAI